MGVSSGVVSAAPEQQADLPSIRLEAKPSRCVALHEGQVCYLNLVVSWNSKEQGDYCLYEKDTDQVLQCWREANQGDYRIDFQSDRSVVYLLRNEGNTGITVETVVTVSWVYNSNTRKTNWRLF